eukprot:5641297-Amphidinium_carterae.1
MEDEVCASCISGQQPSSLEASRQASVGRCVHEKLSWDACEPKTAKPLPLISFNENLPSLMTCSQQQATKDYLQSEFECQFLFEVLAAQANQRLAVPRP